MSLHLANLYLTKQETPRRNPQSPQVAPELPAGRSRGVLITIS